MRTSWTFAPLGGASAIAFETPPLSQLASVLGRSTTHTCIVLLRRTLSLVFVGIMMNQIMDIRLAHYS